MRKERRKVELRTAVSPRDVKHYTTERLREEFLIQNLFVPGEIKLVYSHIDRIITGAAVPLVILYVLYDKIIGFICDRFSAISSILVFLGSGKVFSVLIPVCLGIGIGIGVTLITAILVWILQKIVTLNIPVIGEYVSDIVEIVMKKY